MKISIKELRQTIKSMLTEMPYGPSKHPVKFNLMSHGPSAKFDPVRDSEEDVYDAAQIAFGQIAHDLGVDDLSDDGFLDWLGDHLSDARVPDDMIDRMLAKFQRR